MAILIGSSSISQIYFTNPGYVNPNSITGSVFTLPSSSYTGSGDWANTNGTIGGNAQLFNGPLSLGTNGRWQFNGSSQYLDLTQSIMQNQFQQYNGSAIYQPFTFLFKGTIGSLATKRALFGAEGSSLTSYDNGGDAILRTDTTSSGFIDLDLRGPDAQLGYLTRYTLVGSSGSLLDIAITQDGSGNQNVYQDGSLVGSGSSSQIPTGYAPWSGYTTGDPLLLFNKDTDTDNYNGQLEYIYLYNRKLSQEEIRTVVLPNNPVTASFVYLGSEQVFAQKIFPNDYKLYLNASNTISYPTSGGLWYDISGSNSLTSIFTGSDWVFTGSNSFYYDSDSDFFVTQSQTAFNVLSATSSFSVYTVFKSDNTSGVRQVISKNQGTSNFMGWALGYNTFTGASQGRFGLDFIGVDGVQKRINVEFTPTIGTSSFTHVCATYDGSANASGVILYLDGVSGSKATQVNVNTFTSATNPKTNAYTFIGARNSTAGTSISKTNVFRGKIGAILIYDRKLTAQEVSNIYSELSSSFTN